MTDEAAESATPPDTPPADIPPIEGPIIQLTGPPPRASSVAIVGFAEGHKDLAPYDDPDWEIWGINRLHVKVPANARFDRWFQIHDLRKFHGDDAEHMAWLREFDGTVYLRAEDLEGAGVPGAVPFPADVLVEQFGRYFNNTISWLIAFAILAGFERIGLFGVDMATDALIDGEYSQQRPSCEYFLGIAAGRGIELVLPEGSDLLKTSHLYGFEDGGPFIAKLESRLQEVGKRKEEMKAQLAQIDAQRGQLIAGINQLDGAMQDVMYWRKNWVVAVPPSEGG